ncbi:hypothetical protein JKP88DRAFT_285774 [Tribonema minus]|uniref:Uncharacterized protein n=1 Tax=Tribonema minus TaxID=303371 RepID=A0A835ZG92_9STRA|nr:hypothetical protein JKP88DRAFT_285774 [Tribonema minus]
MGTAPMERKCVKFDGVLPWGIQPLQLAETSASSYDDYSLDWSQLLMDVAVRPVPLLDFIGTRVTHTRTHRTGTVLRVYNDWVEVKFDSGMVDEGLMNDEIAEWLLDSVACDALDSHSQRQNFFAAIGRSTKAKQAWRRCKAARKTSRDFFQASKEVQLIDLSIAVLGTAPLTALTVTICALFGLVFLRTAMFLFSGIGCEATVDAVAATSAALRTLKLDIIPADVMAVFAELLILEGSPDLSPDLELLLGA